MPDYVGTDEADKIEGTIVKGGGGDDKIYGRQQWIVRERDSGER